MLRRLDYKKYRKINNTRMVISHSKRLLKYYPASPLTYKKVNPRIHKALPKKRFSIFYITAKCLRLTAVIIAFFILIGLLCIRDNGNNTKKQEVINNTYINVYYDKLNTIKRVLLDEYIVGVVAAEMPATFSDEALKAQAVAARTYAVSRSMGLYTSSKCTHLGAAVCTDSRHCQAWISKEEAFLKWQSKDAEKYWNKIKNAVVSTKGELLYYDNTIINPLYHSNSGGMTENVEAVWQGNAIPYLKSVPSPGDIQSNGYENKKSLSINSFLSLMYKSYSDFECNLPIDKNDLKILSVNSTGRVEEIKIGNKIIKGTVFRDLFSISSTAFFVEISDNDIIITSHGFGHGVGMSQYGANYLAQKGKSYKEILEYYYTGTKVRTKNLMY